MERRTIAIRDLKPYPGNARKGDIPKIRESLRTHGQYRSIVVQESTGYVLAGNHTMLAADEEGWDRLECDVIDVDDEQARKIVLVDNRSNDLAEYDNKALADLLSELDSLEGTGYDSSDLDALLAEVSPGFGRAGEGNEPPADPITQPGDVIELGPHRLICGDATDQETYERLFAEDRAALVITSPPYNQRLDSFTPSGMQKENPDWVNRMADAYKDSMPEAEYRQDQLVMLWLVHKYTTDNASFFYNHKVRYRDKRAVPPWEWLGDAEPPMHEWQVRQEIIWDRTSSITLNARMFMPQDERIYWLTKGDFKFNDTTEIKSFGTVWRIAPKAEIQVSAPFPTEIPERCIAACSDRGDVVLDPYAGTGTTMVAAEALGRICYSIELDPGYCDVIVDRWERLTGKKAVRPPVDYPSDHDTSPSSSP